MSTISARQSPALPLSSKVLLGMAFAVGISFVFAFVFPYFLSSAALNQYLGKKVWLLIHISMGTIALMVGPFALGLGLSRRRMDLHRRIGLAYIIAIGFSSLAALYLAAHTDVNWVFGLGLSGLGVASLLTTGLALAAIKKRLIAQHQEWMIRSYVVTFGFVNFRILAGILQAANVGTLVERLAAASWFCWAFPLLVTEACLQGRKIFRNSRPQ